MTYLSEILHAKNTTHPIPYKEFEKWSKSPSLEDLGALFVLIFDKSFYEKINPFLSIEDYQGFLLPYFKRCIIENINGYENTTDISTRYEACWELLNWFNYLWKDQEKHGEQLLEIKKYIADLYESNDAEIRVAIVNGILEHLFENKKIRKFFSDWKRNPMLHQAYEEACMFFDYRPKE
ncbi:MAG: hypothetical protein FWG14_03615 [Peptococcaceae bacterium]|nr:hypothetical protein [Peptococcaceae bacterium]